MTYESDLSTLLELPPGIGMYLKFDLNLSNNKVIRKRTVYDLVTFIAEVSGFADLFMVAASFFLGSLYHPQMLQRALLMHMKPL
jgi:hypothetical protein